MLDRVFGDESGVVGRPTRDDEDLVHIPQVLLGQTHLVEHQLAGGAEPPTQRVGHGPRLLSDLLEHEVVVATLFGGGGVPVDVEVLTGRQVAVEVGDLDVVRRDGDDLVLAELDRLPGVLDECRHVAGQIVLAGAAPDDQRRSPAGADDHALRIGVDRQQCERALKPPADPAHRLGEHRTRGGGRRSVRTGGGELLLEQVGGALRVSVAGELDAGGLKFGPQAREVLDDSVVDHGDRAIGGPVRVGVAVVGPAVGRPSGVADPSRAATHASDDLVLDVGHGLLEVGELARALARRSSHR